MSDYQVHAQNTSGGTAARTSSTEPAPDLESFLQHIEQEWEAIRPHVHRSSLLFQRMTNRKWHLEFKNLGTGKTVALKGPGWFIGVPKVSRDGSTFYFTTFPTRSEHKYIIALPLGAKPTVIATLPRLAGSYDISPDHKQIVYQAKKTTGSATHLYIMDLATKATRQFSADGVGGLHPVWSPDGKLMAYVSQRKLRVKGIESGAESIIVDDPLLKELPTWAPDGKTIAYQASANDEWGYELFRVDVDSGTKTQLTRSRGMDVNPAFTADGQSILFTSDRETSRGQPTLYIMSRDGTEVLRDTTAGAPIYFPNISLSAVVLKQPELATVATQPAPAQPAPSPQPQTGVASASAVSPGTSADDPSGAQDISYTIGDLMESLGERQADIDRALDGKHVFYQFRLPTGVLLQAKVPGSAETIDIAMLPHSSLSRPDVTADRTGLFFKFIDQAGRSTHIIHLQRNQPAQDLVSLPLVPDLAVENFDVTEDASKVIFDVRVDELFTIYSYDVASGSALPVLPDNRGGMYPSLSPDDRSLAYIASGKLHILNLETGANKILIDDERLKQHPTWSPDGTQILYQASESTGTGFDLYITDVTSSNPRALFTAPGDDSTPSFAPGGQEIIFTSDGDTPGFGALYRVNIDGSNVQKDGTEVTDILNVR